jgi:hypothetical protein
MADQYLVNINHRNTETIRWEEPRNMAINTMKLTLRYDLLTGEKFLDITITRDPNPDEDPKPGKKVTGRNISRIRLLVPNNAPNRDRQAPIHNRFEFIGNDTNGNEIVFKPEQELGPWACWSLAFHKKFGRSCFEKLGLTQHETADSNDTVYEYS